MKRNEITTIALTGFAIAASLALLYFKKSKEEENAGADAFFAEIESKLSTEARKTSAFGVENRGTAASKKLTTATAIAYAKKINSAFGLFNDDEAAIREVIRAVKSREQMSQVAREFEKLTGNTMLSVFEDNLLNDWISRSYYDEFEQLVLSKPAYI